MVKPRASVRLKTGGFTLMEIAIVLCIAGLIISAVWTAAQSVREGQKRHIALQQIEQVVQNIREYYMNAQGIPYASTDVTAQLDTLAGDVTIGGKISLFPIEMRTPCTGCTGDAYKIDSIFGSVPNSGGGIGGGSFRVLVVPAAGSVASKFRVILMGVPAVSCAKLLFSGVGYQDQTLGVTALCASSDAALGHPCYNGTGWQNLTCSNNICLPGTYTAPLTLAQVQTLCGTSTSEIAWEFNLRN